MKSINQLLKNKYVFYATFIIAIANILGYISKNDINSLILFVAIYIICSHFTKNVIVRLVITILATAFLRGPIKREWHWFEREGFKEGVDDGEGDDDDAEVEDDNSDAEVEDDNSDADDADDDDADHADGDDDEFKAMDPTLLQSSQLKNLLNNVKTANSDNLSEQKSKLNDQYKKIQGLLDPNLVNKNPNLNKNDIKLKQEQLKHQMKDMQPIIESTQKLLQTFENSGIMKMFEKLSPAINGIAQKNNLV
tara:strand:+ start:483 stop:1235 length:753 start_codon:yes stop_codon:yes gene_type:complete